MKALLKLWSKYCAAFMAALVLGLVPQQSGLKLSLGQTTQGLGQIAQAFVQERALVTAEQRLNNLGTLAVGDDLNGLLPWGSSKRSCFVQLVSAANPQILIGWFLPPALARAPPVFA